MAFTGARLHVLLVCSWQTDTRELRDAISAAGYALVVRRADFEAALRAALADRFDIAGYVPTPGLKRETVQSIFREHAPSVTVAVADTVDALAHEIIRVLEQRCS